MMKSPRSPHTVIEVLEARIAPATFIVTTVADSGPGSLRQAILDANALSGADTIGFDIPGDQLQIISLASPLPAITDQVTISALATYFSRTEFVRIDGTNAGQGATGLTIAANGTIIAGIEIANFSGSGVHITGSSNTLWQNYISGNGGNGVHVDGGQENTVFWNTIGSYTDVSGFGSGTGNHGNGVLVENATSTSIAPPQSATAIGGISLPAFGVPSGNQIHGNGLFGIEIRESESIVIAKNQIQNNGTLASISGTGGGIAVLNSRGVSLGALYTFTNPNQLPHSEKAVFGNTISSNAGHGVLIQGQESAEITLAGNVISSNASDGVHIEAATDVQFGLSFSDSYVFSSGPNGSASGWKMAGNTISGNTGWGLSAADGASDVTVQGSEFTGNGSGAILFDQVSGAIVGGLKSYSWFNGRFSTLTYDANKFDFGAAVGISVQRSEGVQITSNSFVGTGIPIDLGGDGATSNDPGDSDTGANHLQNYPELVISNSQLTGSLSTDAANSQFRVQVFRFDPASGYTLLSAQEITTGLDGKALVNFGNITLSAGQTFHATATNLATGETSEMSTAAVVKPAVTVGSVSIGEGNSGVRNASFTITLGSATTVPVKVSYRTVSDIALAGEDYAAAEGFIIFEPGETSKSINIPVFGDSVEEANERFFLELTDVENGVISNARGTGTIVDDDSTLSIENAQFLEGQPSAPGTRTVHLPVRLSKATDIPVTVDFSTHNGTAEAFTDYVITSGTLTFAPGQTLQFIELQIVGDLVYEPDETFSVTLSNQQGAQMGNSIGVVTIKSDEPSISLQGASRAEGHSGSKSLLFTVTLSQPQTSAVTVGYATADGTAAAGSDYTSISGTLTFAPGETSKTIAVPVLGDSQFEADETLRLLLSNASGAGLATSEATGSILNDDVAPDLLNLVISHGGRKATWTDSDGDIVTLTATRSILTASSFNFASDPESGSASLLQLNLPSDGGPSPVGLNFTVKKSATGDGLVTVGGIDATGRDLTQVNIAGHLGSIVAGDDNLKTPAIRKLAVTSFGLDPSSIEVGTTPLVSEVNGSIGTFVVKRDFVGANLSVIGGGIQTLSIGGSLLGTASDAPTGISVEKSLMNLRVGGDIRGSDSLHPVEITTSTAPLARATLALKDLRVAGDVANTNIIAGANSQAAVSVGKIFVRGDWSASNLAVGAGAGPDELFGTDDDIPYQSAVSRIAQIVIRGDITGTDDAVSETDHFGFVAGRIAAFQVGAGKVPLSAKWKDSIEIGTTSDVMIRELAGRTRLS